MLYRFARLACFTLLIAAWIGCDSGGDGGGNGGGGNGGGGNGGGGNGGGGAAVTARIEGEDFSSDDVFANAVSSGFTFSAVDGQWTILISIQSVDGESLTARTYPMGEDPSNPGFFAGGSAVFDSEGNNTVYNSVTGSGQIVLQDVSSSGMKGTFSFDGESVSGLGVTVTNGAFDVEF